MRPRQPLPKLWLLTDARNDGALEQALRRLPRGSGLVFRHYHLPPDERRARFDRLAQIARGRGHLMILADDPRVARRWRADGVYGAPCRLGPTGALVVLATAHSGRELAAAHRVGADAAFLSPVFATRSHPGGKPLGAVRFRLLAARSAVAVIALGGMNARSAGRLAWPSWGAIDGMTARDS